MVDGEDFWTGESGGSQADRAARCIKADVSTTRRHVQIIIIIVVRVVVVGVDTANSNRNSQPSAH